MYVYIHINISLINLNICLEAVIVSCDCIRNHLLIFCECKNEIPLKFSPETTWLLFR